MLLYDKRRNGAFDGRLRVREEKIALQNSRRVREERINRRLKNGQFTVLRPDKDDILYQLGLVGELGNGLSMTNVWLLKHKETKELFVWKFFISPIPYKHHTLISELYNYKMIYEIVKKTKAPFFVELAGVYSRLGYDIIQGLFRRAFGEHEDFRLRRNLIYSMCYDCHFEENEGRKPKLVHEADVESGCTHGLQDFVGPVERLLYCGVLTRYETGYDPSDPTKVILADFLLDDGVLYNDKICVLFQLAWGLFIMHDNNMVHNDPHEGNIIVRKYPSKKQIQYNMLDGTYGQTTFITNSEYCVKIFDHDLTDSYQIRNAGLTDYRAMQCTLDERRDVVYLNRTLSAYMNIQVDRRKYPTVVVDNQVNPSLQFHTRIPGSRQAMLSLIYSKMSSFFNPQEQDGITLSEGLALSLRNRHYRGGVCHTFRSEDD